MLVKPIGLPVIFYSLGRGRILFFISLLFFAIALLWLPSVFVGTGYAFHETTEYIRSLTTRVPHLSHDLYNKYNQSAAAIAVRLFAPRHGRGLFSQGAAATAGFVFQLALSTAVVVWILVRRSGAAGSDSRLSLAALFCTMPAFSPVSWLEYYMVLEVPYMALTFIACSDAARKPCPRIDGANRARRRTNLEPQHPAIRAAPILRRRIFWFSGDAGGGPCPDRNKRVPSAKVPAEPDLRRWFYLSLGRLTNTAAATTEVHSPSRSPIADCVTLRVVTILSDTFQMSLRSS